MGIISVQSQGDCTTKCIILPTLVIAQVKFRRHRVEGDAVDRDTHQNVHPQLFGSKSLARDISHGKLVRLGFYFMGVARVWKGANPVGRDTIRGNRSVAPREFDHRPALGQHFRGRDQSQRGCLGYRMFAQVAPLSSSLKATGQQQRQNKKNWSDNSEAHQ